METTSKFISLLSTLLPGLTALVGVVSMFLFLARGSLRLGSFRFDFEGGRSDRVIRERIAEDIKTGNSPQNALMQEYHTQGLSQSRISFWFSLVFASLGFAIIALSVGIFLQGNPFTSGGWLESAGKPTFTMIAGTIIDAVAALFFVQSNKARQLMTEFFDKLRVDRKLDEALQLMKDIHDPIIASRIKGVVALTFADVALDKLSLTEMLSAHVTSPDNPPQTSIADGNSNNLGAHVIARPPSQVATQPVISPPRRPATATAE
jgi:hypothetical protein